MTPPWLCPTMSQRVKAQLARTELLLLSRMPSELQAPRGGFFSLFQDCSFLFVVCVCKALAFTNVKFTPPGQTPIVFHRRSNSSRRLAKVKHRLAGCRVVQKRNYVCDQNRNFPSRSFPMDLSFALGTGIESTILRTKSPGTARL